MFSWNTLGAEPSIGEYIRGKYRLRKGIFVILLLLGSVIIKDTVSRLSSGQKKLIKKKNLFIMDSW